MIMEKKKSIALSADQCIVLYEKMLLIRRFEERAAQLYGMGLIGGFCHLYIGQEAVVVGVQSQLEKQDTIITSYRDHGHMLACDMDPIGVMTELTGRITGYSKGKGGSMHMFSKEKNFFGGHGIVGATVSIGTGLALSHKYKKDNGIATVYYGDGAANQGQVFESFNMASLLSLPALYIIENNKYSMGTSQNRGCAGEDLYRRGEPFGIKGEKVNGMDIIKVISAAKNAIETVRKQKKPYILEMDTYRYKGHSMSDPAKYRTKDEVEKYKQSNDPILNLLNYMDKKGYKENTRIEKIEQKIKSTMKTVVERAKNDPFPKDEELHTDILI